MMYRTNQNGVTGFQALLVSITVVLVGLASWYAVAHNDKPLPVKSNNVNAATLTTKKPAPTVDATTKDWTVFNSKDGAYSLRYPTTWVTAANLENCDNTVLIAPTKDSVGGCQTDGAGEVSVTATGGDTTANYTFEPDKFTGIENRDVIVSGVTGKRYSGIYNADNFVGPAKGSKQVNYVFYVNGKTIVAAYNQAPNYPDVLADFETIVTKTLSFN